jgi:hypothetical protein
MLLVAHDAGSLYGTHHALWYVLEAWPTLLFTLLPMFVIGVIVAVAESNHIWSSALPVKVASCPCTHCWLASHHTHDPLLTRGTQSRPDSLLLAIVGVTLVYSLLAHKEFRYVQQRGKN